MQDRRPAPSVYPAPESPTPYPHSPAQDSAHTIPTPASTCPPVTCHHRSTCPRSWLRSTQSQTEPPRPAPQSKESPTRRPNRCCTVRPSIRRRPRHHPSKSSERSAPHRETASSPATSPRYPASPAPPLLGLHI